MLTNDSVSFEQLGPGLYVYPIMTQISMRVRQDPGQIQVDSRDSVQMCFCL